MSPNNVLFTSGRAHHAPPVFAKAARAPVYLSDVLCCDRDKRTRNSAIRLAAIMTKVPTRRSRCTETELRD
ncbi:unnamed protein product, partial [Iphiclides podalirius]